jgi:hypothetical protein
MRKQYGVFGVLSGIHVISLPLQQNSAPALALAVKQSLTDTTQSPMRIQ